MTKKNIFGRDVWKAWAEFHFKTPEQLGDIVDQIVYLNLNIRIRDKPIMEQKFTNLGLERLVQLFHGREKRLLTNWELKEKFG